jgi:hypothetical protein
VDSVRLDMPHIGVRCVCTNGCGITGLKVETKERHETQLCPKRVVRCPIGCGMIGLLAENEFAHERYECPLRRMPCRLGKTNLLEK